MSYEEKLSNEAF